MHPYLAATLATNLTRERVDAAAARAAARAVGRPGRGAGDAGALVIRRARPEDAVALERLGDLDGDRRAGEALARQARDGAVLVAEDGGALVAALALDGRAAAADPFRRSAVHAELLRLRARQLGGDAAGGPADHPRLGVLRLRLP